MILFSKNQVVIKVLHIMGLKTAVIGKVTKVSKGVAYLKDCESLKWDAKTGLEIDPAIPGCYSEIIALDGDQENHIKLETL